MQDSWLMVFFKKIHFQYLLIGNFSLFSFNLINKKGYVCHSAISFLYIIYILVLCFSITTFFSIK